jgi:hypothetical protein
MPPQSRSTLLNRTSSRVLARNGRADESGGLAAALQGYFR